MDEDTLIDTLDQAVELCRSKGYDADGWTMQRDIDGFVAWVFWEDENSQGAVFDEVQILSTPMAAARYCLARADALPSKVETVEIEN